MPQAQPPSAPHESAPVALQVLHTPASMPQVARLGASHWFCGVQQPLEQLDESHLQPWAVQCWPAAHAAPPSQLQLPPAQVLATSPLHWLQELPPVPHWKSVGGLTQALPLQQPFGQLPALQAPPVQE